MGPWTDLVLMCLISCSWLAQGEPVREEPAGVVFDQSSWALRPGWLLSPAANLSLEDKERRML